MGNLAFIANVWSAAAVLCYVVYRFVDNKGDVKTSKNILCAACCDEALGRGIVCVWLANKWRALRGTSVKL